MFKRIRLQLKTVGRFTQIDLNNQLPDSSDSVFFEILATTKILTTSES